MLKKYIITILVSILVPVLSNGAEFKINTGKYDERFTSPEKTYSLYKKLLLAGDLVNVTECLMPKKAEQYYSFFNKLREIDKLKEFANSLPKDIHIESDLDPYYFYEMICEQNGKIFSSSVEFIKIPSGIYLINNM